MVLLVTPVSVGYALAAVASAKSGLGGVCGEGYLLEFAAHAVPGGFFAVVFVAPVVAVVVPVAFEGEFDAFLGGALELAFVAVGRGDV